MFGTRECARAETGDSGIVIARESGYAEIEKLYAAICADENISRFQIAMDNETSMRIGDRRRDIDNEIDARSERPRLHIHIDRLAAHEFEREPRLSVGQFAAVEQAHDVGMFQFGEHVAFAHEQRALILAHGFAIDQLECDFLVIGAVSAFGAIHDTHAAAADFLDHAPRADARAWRQIERFGGDEIAHEGALQQTASAHPAG